MARRPMIEAILTATLVLVMIFWTWPALEEVRKTIAPPIVAVQWIREHVDRRTQTIYVHDGMIPYAERYLADYRLVFTGDTGPTGPASALQPGFFLIEGSSNAAHAYNFVWPRERLWKIVRRRYFEVSLQPVTDVVDRLGRNRACRCRRCVHLLRPHAE